MKIVDFGASGTIVSAVKKYRDFISPTYGPAGKKILIPGRAIDDGKIASQEFELENEHENQVIAYIKETTAKTDERVGDGTTTAAIIMSEIVTSVLEPENEFVNVPHPHTEVLSLKKGVQEAVSQIKKLSKKIKTKEELCAVAYNSYNNEEAAKLISDTLFTIGDTGSISVHDSHAMITDCEIGQGLEIDKGFISPYLINKEDRVSLEDPAIVLIGQKVNSFNDLLPTIKLILEGGNKEFVIIAESFGDEAIAGVIINRMKGIFTPLLVEAPGYGDRKLELLEDIAAVTGAKVLDPKKGDSFEKVSKDIFGSAKSVISKKDSTVLIGGKGTKKSIEERISFIEKTTSKESKYDLEKAKERIAALSGGVAVIRVGAPTENEQKAIKAKIEDAVNATKAAFKHGVVPGAGVTLQSLNTSSKTLNKALEVPRKVLEENGKQFLDEKVHDPTQVLIASLETAVSIASELIEVSAIVSEKRKKEERGY